LNSLLIMNVCPVGYKNVTKQECEASGCCYQPDHQDHKPWCFHPGLVNATGQASIEWPDAQACFTRSDMLGVSLPDLCVTNGVLELVVNDEPQYLVPK